jgi:hypothetical protein
MGKSEFEFHIEGISNYAPKHRKIQCLLAEGSYPTHTFFVSMLEHGMVTMRHRLWVDHVHKKFILLNEVLIGITFAEYESGTKFFQMF